MTSGGQSTPKNHDVNYEQPLILSVIVTTTNVMKIFRHLPPAREEKKQPLQSFEQKASTDFFEVLATDSLLWRQVLAVLASFGHID